MATYLCSAATKEKMRLAHLGRKFSEKTIEKMRIAAQNRPKISDETRRKLRESHQGPRPWRLGFKHTEEAKIKIGLASKGRKERDIEQAKHVRGLQLREGAYPEQVGEHG
jgi:hypothetical protein